MLIDLLSYNDIIDLLGHIKYHMSLLELEPSCMLLSFLSNHILQDIYLELYHYIYLLLFLVTYQVK